MDIESVANESIHILLCSGVAARGPERMAFGSKAQCLFKVEFKGFGS